MSVPVCDSALSTHLLKLGPQGLPRLIANERACIRALARARLEVNQAEVVVDRTGEQALLVARFDRHASAGVVRARRQLDGCQVAGRYPADKYDLDTVDVVNALADVCANPTVAALRLLEQVAASYLIGNGDLHAKNLSVSDRGKGLEPTPAYDVTFTHPYGDTDTMALPICGEAKVARIGRRALPSNSRRCGRGPTSSTGGSWSSAAIGCRRERWRIDHLASEPGRPARRETDLYLTDCSPTVGDTVLRVYPTR